jgi:endoglucanase
LRRGALRAAAGGGQVSAACQWPAWEQFKKAYVSPEGRVIDPSDARKISTSEGQSYGLFFALAANDRAGSTSC